MKVGQVDLGVVDASARGERPGAKPLGQSIVELVMILTALLGFSADAVLGEEVRDSRDLGGQRTEQLIQARLIVRLRDLPDIRAVA